MNEFEYGERVLVNDSSLEGDWREAYFIAEISTHEVTYLVSTTEFSSADYLLYGKKCERFSYIKKYHEESFEINILKNGEPYTGTISEETARNLGIID